MHFGAQAGVAATTSQRAETPSGDEADRLPCRPADVRDPSGSTTEVRVATGQGEDQKPILPTGSTAELPGHSCRLLDRFLSSAPRRRASPPSGGRAPSAKTALFLRGEQAQGEDASPGAGEKPDSSSQVFGPDSAECGSCRRVRGRTSPREHRTPARWQRQAGVTDSTVEQGPEVEGGIRAWTASLPSPEARRAHPTARGKRPR